MDIHATLGQTRRPQDSGRRFYILLAQAIFIAVVMVVMQGCATTVPPIESVTAAALPAKYFRLQGRISVRVADKLDSGKLVWNKSADEERLSFYTPFGSQVAEMAKKATGPVLLKRDNETLSAESISELTAMVLGVPLDMESIAAWTQGIGLKENESVEKRFANGDVWQVTAEKFQTQGEYRFVTRLTAVSAETVVKLVIDEWHAE